MSVETTPSDGDAERLRIAIRALVRRFQLAERSDVACCGVTVAQAAALEALAGGDGLRLGELGSRLGITASTLSRNLARLEERGLVRRRPDAADRRAAVVELTPGGRSAAAAVVRREAAFAREILDRLSGGDPAAALSWLERLLEAIRTATEGCCPGAFDHLMSGPEWTGCCERNGR